MVARGDKSRCQSPCFNVHVELDNRALKAKNNGLIQSVAKLQQENAELSKQVTLLQGESFELKSRYNNLKNVISIIDSTTKTCLPKLNEVVETFTGIIQLCSVAANISNLNRDTRTQAVKPQIVNGHVLHNPTITLSRLDNDDVSYTPPRASTSRISSNILIRPSTSRSSNDVHRDRNSNLNGNQDEDSDTENQNENGLTEDDMEEDTSFICQATRGVCERKKSNVDLARLQEDDSEASDEELEMPLAEEEEIEDDQRLTTIQEDVEEEEEEDEPSPMSPRTRQRRFLKGRLQEVKIYLNQLPTTYIEQFMGSGNISISVSPPERRSSYKQRPSSLVNETDGSFLDENISVLSTVRMEDFKIEDNSPLNRSRPKLSVTFKGSSSAKSPTYFESTCGSSHDGTLQFSKNLSPIHNLPATTSRSSSSNDSSEMPSLTLRELGLMPSDSSQRRTSTPIVSRKSSESLFSRSGSLNKSTKSETSFTFKTNVTKRRVARFSPIVSRKSRRDLFRPCDSLNRLSKSETSFKFKSNITKRRVASKEKKKVAQVLLDRLSGGKSDSPHDKIKDIVKSPLITSRTQIKTRSKGKSVFNSSNSEEENVENHSVATMGMAAKRKKSSQTPKVRKIKKEPLTPVMKSPLKKSPAGRPKRAARPTTLKEPNLHKKMRRSK